MPLAHTYGTCAITVNSEHSEKTILENDSRATNFQTGTDWHSGFPIRLTLEYLFCVQNDVDLISFCVGLVPIHMYVCVLYVLCLELYMVFNKQ